MEPGNAPEGIGGNMAGDANQGTPVHPAGDQGASKAELRALLRDFIQSGSTKKETAELLVWFCAAETGPWVHHDNDNNAAPPPSPPTELFGSLTPSSRSSQNPSTQPQTPTSDHNPSLAQQYALDHHQLPQEDAVELRSFLLRLLAHLFQNSAPAMLKSNQQKVQDLFDRSSLPGHGTQQAFEELLLEAVTPRSTTTFETELIGAPNMAPFHHFHDGSPVLQQYSPSFQAPSPLQPQNQPFQGYQQSQSHQRSAYDVGDHLAHVPNLNIANQQLNAQLQQNYPVSSNLGQDQTTHQQMLPAANHSQMDNSPVSPFGFDQFSLNHGSNENAASPTDQTSPLNKTRQASRQKKSNAAPIAKALPNPLKNAPSKDEKKEKEVSNKVVIHCKLLTKDGKPCSKACSSEDAKNAEGNACKFLIEHIHRAHPDHYIANLPSSRKSLNDMFNVQIATCTILLANGQPCTWRSASDKPWKAGIEHIRDHHPQNFRAELLAPGTKPNFDAMVRGYEVIRCPFYDNKKGSQEKCIKYCSGEQAYRSLIEHVRRFHFDKEQFRDHYLPIIRKSHPHLATGNSLKSSQETLTVLLQLYNDNETPQATAMESSTSNNSASRRQSWNHGLPQQQQVPQDDAQIHMPPATGMASVQQIQQFSGNQLDCGPPSCGQPNCVPPAMLQMDPVDHMNYRQTLDPPFLYDSQNSSDPDTMTLGIAPESGGQDRIQPLDMDKSENTMAYSNARPMQDPTLRPMLFAGYVPNATFQQHHHQLQDHVYQQQGQVDYGGQAALGGMSSTSPMTPETLTGFANLRGDRAETFSRKREREDMDGGGGEDSQEMPSKRMSVLLQQDAFPASAFPSPNAAPAHATNTQISAIGFSQGDESLTSPAFDSTSPYGLEDASGTSVPPVDGVGSGGGLPAFDFSNFGVNGDGAQGGGGDDDFVLFDNTEYGTEWNG